MPTLVMFLLLLIALSAVAATMLIALPRLEGRLMEDLSPAPAPAEGPTGTPGS